MVSLDKLHVLYDTNHHNRPTRKVSASNAHTFKSEEPTINMTLSLPTVHWHQLLVIETVWYNYSDLFP